VNVSIPNGSISPDIIFETPAFKAIKSAIMIHMRSGCNRHLLLLGNPGDLPNKKLLK
jgi:hypothetical protein